MNSLSSFPTGIVGEAKICQFVSTEMVTKIEIEPLGEKIAAIMVMIGSSCSTNWIMDIGREDD